MLLAEASSSAGLIPPIAWAVLRMVGALALLGAGAWALLRWRQRSSHGRAALQVLERTMLTRTTSLALVSVSGKRLLLGISADGVRLLSDLETETPTDDAHDFDLALHDVVDRDEATG